jgi:hypothetical protein
MLKPKSALIPHADALLQQTENTAASGAKTREARSRFRAIADTPVAR